MAYCPFKRLRDRGNYFDVVLLVWHTNINPWYALIVCQKEKRVKDGIGVNMGLSETGLEKRGRNSVSPEIRMHGSVLAAEKSVRGSVASRGSEDAEVELQRRCQGTEGSSCLEAPTVIVISYFLAWVFVLRLMGSNHNLSNCLIILASKLLFLRIWTRIVWWEICLIECKCLPLFTPLLF